MEHYASVLITVSQVPRRHVRNNTGEKADSTMTVRNNLVKHKAPSYQYTPEIKPRKTIQSTPGGQGL